MNLFIISVTDQFQPIYNIKEVIKHNRDTFEFAIRYNRDNTDIATVKIYIN